MKNFNCKLKIFSCKLLLIENFFLHFEKFLVRVEVKKPLKTSLILLKNISLPLTYLISSPSLLPSTLTFLGG